jgi:hypothetical protein
MQRIQRAAHAAISRQTEGRFLPGWAVRSIRFASPVLQRVLARVLGLGFRPEHVAD